MWQQWINGVLGLWVILVPFLGLTEAQDAWTLTISGLAIAALGFWGAAQHAATHRSSMRHA